MGCSIWGILLLIYKATKEKRKAINLLADILEPLRNELKNILNEEWEFNKNLHDNLIFEIVNNFNIRHNKEVKN